MTVEFDEKEKSKAQHRHESSITFIVDQQLEACLDAIAQNSNHHDVEIKVLNRARYPDSVAFSAMLYRDRVSIIRFRGTLRRWQGTATKVEAQMTSVNPIQFPFGSALFLLIVVFLTALEDYLETPLAERTITFPALCGFGLAVLLIMTIYWIVKHSKHIQRLRNAMIL